ncbi:MAG TPA: oligosaccharide flippase family protein [bacterium]|nr:oligosaccharide flippase family protein [bacterium]
MKLLSKNNFATLVYSTKYAISSLLFLSAQLIINIKLGRTFGPDLLGYYYAANSNTRVAGAALDFGLSQYAFKDISVTPGNIAHYRDILLPKRIILTIFLFPIIFIISRIVSREYYLELFFIISAATIIELLYNLWTNILAACGHYNRIMMCSLTYLLIMTIFVFFSQYSFLLFTQVLFLVTILVLFMLLKYHLDTKTFNNAIRHFFPFKFPLRHCFNIMTVNLVNIGISKMPIILLSLSSSNEEIGLFSASYAIYSSLLIIPASLSVSYLNRLSGYHAELRVLQNKYKRILPLFILLGFAVVVTISPIANTLIQQLFGSKFIDSIKYLKILSFAAVLSFPNYFATNFFIIFGYDIKVVQIKTLIFVFYFFCAYYFVARYSIIGIIYATIMIEAIQFILFNILIFGIQDAKNSQQ